MFFFFSVPGHSNNSIRCSGVYKSHSDLDITKLNEYRRQYDLDIELVKKIDWDALENGTVEELFSINKVLSNIRLAEHYLRKYDVENTAPLSNDFMLHSSSNSEEFYKATSEFYEVLMSTFDLKKIRTFAANHDLNKNQEERQREIDYILISLKAINKLDSKRRIFPIAYAGSYGVKDQLNSQKIAEDLVQKAASDFSNVLSTSGFRNLEEFRRLANQDPVLKEAIDFFKERRFVVSMNAPASLREQILNFGFRNQHETDSSNGSLDQGERNHRESKLIGMNQGDFENLSPLVKPKYGYVRPNDFSIPVWRNILSYGKDVWVFKTDKIKNRVTYTPIDSYEITNPLVTREIPEWGHRFIPDEFRELVAPFFYRYFAHDNQTWIPSFTSSHISHLTNKSSNKWNRIQNMQKYQASLYLEAQIWGHLGIKDVDTFIFIENPPSKEFRELLESHRIKILDGRSLLKWGI